MALLENRPPRARCLAVRLAGTMGSATAAFLEQFTTLTPHAALALRYSPCRKSYPRLVLREVDDRSARGVWLS